VESAPNTRSNANVLAPSATVLPEARTQEEEEEEEEEEGFAGVEACES
jgi:hypothetical protein